MAIEMGHPDDAPDLLRDGRDALRAGLRECCWLGKNYTPFPNKYTGLFITNWTVNLLFIVDIVFNFLTAVYDPQLNKWLLRFDQIAVHYARGWMTLDIVSMLPVEYMIKSKQASAIRLLRVFRLMKLAKVSVSRATPGIDHSFPRRSVKSSSTTSPSTLI